jgi:cleavage stimulation factor subunit 2
MNRKLRVDYSSEGRVDNDDDRPGGAGGHAGSSGGGGGGYGQSHANGAAQAASLPPVAGALPPLPPGKELPPGVTFQDAVSRTLQTLPPAQLLDILASMKSLAVTDPARATELLTQAPQLSYAIFQALLLMGLVSPESIHSVVDGNVAPAPSQAQAPAPLPTAGYPAPPVANFAGVASGTPPVANPYAPPTLASAQATYAPSAAAPAAAPVPAQDPDALMKMVMELPQATIDQLPEGERQQIMALRAQFGMLGR